MCVRVQSRRLPRLRRWCRGLLRVRVREIWLGGLCRMTRPREEKHAVAHLGEDVFGLQIQHTVSKQPQHH